MLGTRARAGLILLCLGGLPASSSQAALVGLWRFDEDASPQPDSTGNAQNAELRNDVKWVNDGERGGVMEFDGDQDYLEVADTDLLSIEGDMTVAAWAKFVSYENWNSIVSKTGSAETNKPAPYDVYTANGNNGRVSMYIGDGANSLQNFISTDPAELEVWQHIAVTVTADGDVVHYLNGELNGEGTVNANAIDNDTNLFIGSRADFVTNMLGRLDDVAIFNEVLSQEQVQMIRAGEFGPFGVGDFIPGDFNGDGVQDIADYDIMVSNFNTPGGFADGDFDFNGNVNLRDFFKFRAAFNSPPEGVAASVPEPASLALIGVGILGCGFAVRRGGGRRRRFREVQARGR